MTKQTENRLAIERQLHKLRQAYYIRPTFSLKNKIKALKAELFAIQQTKKWEDFLAK